MIRSARWRWEIAQFCWCFCLSAMVMTP